MAEQDNFMEQAAGLDNPQAPSVYKEPSINPFNAPIPGQSLTDTPGNYGWEHPPQFASVEEAADDVYENLMQEDNMARMLTLLRMGIPIEALVKVITFSGFLEGKWTVDVARLLEPIVAMMITGEASLAKVPAKINLKDARDDDFYRDMAERKLDMQESEEMMKQELDMPDSKAADIKGLMAKLGE